MPLRCVVIEDVVSENELLQYLAHKAGFEVDWYLKAETFLKEDDFNYACFLVDWNLPGISGVDLIPMIREKNQLASIFIVTANYDSKDICTGLASGADDYILKPFDPNALQFKLTNALTKFKAIKAGNLNVGVQFIEDAKILSVEGQKIFLTETEYKIIKTLYDKRGINVPREELESLLYNPDNRAIDVHMYSIRKKIKDTAMVIKNQRGVGYLWVK